MRDVSRARKRKVNPMSVWPTAKGEAEVSRREAGQAEHANPGSRASQHSLQFPIATDVPLLKNNLVKSLSLKPDSIEQKLFMREPQGKTHTSKKKMHLKCNL